MKVNNIKLIAAVFALVVVIVGAFYLYITLREKEGNVVVINNCSNIDPERLEVSKGSEILFENKDKSNHRLTIGGKAIDVKAGESVTAKAEFPYGAATYSYDCDGTLNAAELAIVGESVSANISESLQPFGNNYDNLSSSLRDCVRKALGGEFNKAYSDPNYEISIDALSRMKSCSEEPHKADIAFKDYYDSRGRTLQDCLRNGLGDEFDKLYRDTEAELTTEHRTNMVACLTKD